jgi:hypothetical protein
MKIKRTSTYKIIYDNETSDIDIFEIECNLEQHEDGYCTEIHVTSNIGNIIKYTTKKQAACEFDMDSFCKNTDSINRLHSWLWECHDNKPTDFKSAELRHKTLLDELGIIVDVYCKMYGFDYDL